HPVVIVGAGLTGLSTALHLRELGYRGPLTMLERDDRIGGKAQSERIHGHTFDVTGHWLHLRNAHVQALVSRLFAADDLVEIERRTGIFTQGVMLPSPFQANLHGLPRGMVAACLVDFIEAQRALARGEGEASPTFRAFAESQFGRSIAEAFFIP